jgi:hypothetical protein
MIYATEPLQAIVKRKRDMGEEESVAKAVARVQGVSKGKKWRAASQSYWVTNKSGNRTCCEGFGGASM